MGKGMPRKIKYTKVTPSVQWDADVPYDVWYVPQFPLKRLRYRDLDAIDGLGIAARQRLQDDIKQRGMKCPLLVFNHQHLDPELKMLINKPYHLRVGRNRRFVLERLGWTSAPCIVTGPCEFPGVKLTPETLPTYWTDGNMHLTKNMVYVHNKTDFLAYEYPL